MKVNLSKYSKAVILRRRGKSYAEISAELKIAKSTTSNWFVNEPWSKEVKISLNKLRLKNSKKHLMAANIAKIGFRKKRENNYLNEARAVFKKQINDPLFLLGLGIYWGEGDMSYNGRVGVINTDPELLKIMANFYRKCLGVLDKDLRVGLFLYEDIEVNSAIKFWSKVLRVPLAQFIKVQVLKSRSKLTKNKSKYGICSLYCSSTELRIKIHEWIRLLSIRNAGIV